MKEEIQRAIEHLSVFDREHASEAMEAARALGVLGAEALCAVLDTPAAMNVPGGRRTLSAEIARQDPDAVTPALLTALARKDWRPVQVACDAIMLMGEVTVPVLIDNLEKEKESEGRLNTILVLRRMGVLAAGPVLERLATEDKVVEVRAAAVEALGWLGAEGARDAALAALSDESPPVRLKAVRAAGWLKAWEAVDGVLAFARSADAEGRAAAVYALDRIGDTRATPFVADRLTDPDPYVRWSAAVALRRLRQAGCEQPLARALHDEEETVAAAALETLCLAAPDVARNLLPAAVDDPRPAVRRTAAYYQRPRE